MSSSSSSAKPVSTQQPAQNQPQGNKANGALGSPISNQPTFNSNPIINRFLELAHAEDQEGEQDRQTIRSQCDAYKDQVIFANNHFSNESPGLKQVTFHAKKSFFNHKYATQEVLRSQHLYKMLHELKYTPDKNLKSYPDVLESGYKEVLKVDDKVFEIRDALIKWYQHRLDMITFVRRELQKQYFELFACELDAYSEQSTGIETQLKQAEEARIEVEDIMRNLQSELFFKSSRHYEKHHLPELSVVCEGGNDVIERIYSKRLKNFPYITQNHIKRYFNDFSNQHHCMRKVKKIRLVNDFLMYKIQFLHTQKQAKSATLSKTALNFEADEMLRELNKSYAVRRSYLLPNDKITIEKSVAEFAKQLDIKEDVNIDYGCLLLFAVDKKFDMLILEQSEGFLLFHPYDLNPPFVSMKKEKTLTKQAQELSKTIEKERSLRDNVKIRTSKSWIDNVQILESQEINLREQDAVFELYEDTLINGWLRFLLCTDESLINQKITKEISVFKDRFLQLNKKQFEEIFYQFYSRYLKLLFLKSRKSLIKILSYINYFRCLQKNLNISYVEQLHQQQNNHPSTQQQQQQQQSQQPPNAFNPTAPLFQQSEQMINDKFFLTNPSLASYGNLTQFKAKSASQKSKEDYTKVAGKATVDKESHESQEPNILYEEEVMSIENDIVTIRDHNSLKIIYDASMHDFHGILKKIAEICSFYFHFKIKHDMSQKDKEKGMFKDNFDRESLIDTVLNLEAQYYLKKVKVVENLKRILMNTYYPDLRNQLIRLIATLLARRPRMNLFENRIFECYHFEIQNLNTLNEIINEVLLDIESEEDNLVRIKTKIALTTNTSDDGHDKLTDFYKGLKQPQGHTRKFSYFMSGITKLVLNIEQNRVQFAQLIPSAQSEPGVIMSDILKCENAYLKDLLDSTKKIIRDSQGSNFCADFLDFRFIEKEETLDSIENFDAIANRIQSHIDEKTTKQEREKMDFNAFSMLEFMKVRRKLNNFLFGLASLMEIYRIQVTRVGEDFKDKFENAIDISSIPSAGQLDPNRKNYLKLLLDVGGIKLAKEISTVDNWVGFITQTKGLVQLTQFLEALILCSQLTQNYVILNNIYAQAVLNDMPKEFFKKIKHAAPDYFKNVFEMKKAIATDTITFVRNQELNKNNKVKENEEATGKNFTMQVFCKQLKREVQFEAMKIQTLLQRIQIEKFSKKLPFEEQIFKFQPISPVKEPVVATTSNNVQQSMTSNMLSAVQIEEELDSKGEVFFDSLGCAVKIFNLPSVEQISVMSHGDFEQVMQRYGVGDLPDDTDEENDGDEDKNFEKSHHSGGKEWLKVQEKKLEGNTSLLCPNRSMKFSSGSASLNGFRKRQFLEHQQLLYLRKTQLFVLWKILGNLVNILSLSTFECSLEANPMDMLYFSHGQLGLEKCRIDSTNNLSDEPISQANLTQRLMPSAKSLKDLATNNKKAIPVFKRNELRMRRDIEVLKQQMWQLDANLQTILNNPNIAADTNEAIMCYLEKMQNRHFLTVVLLLLKQLNAARDKNDIEFMLRLRSILIDLNFPQMTKLAKQQHDGRVLVANHIKLKDSSANFTQSPDLKIFDSNSPYMNMIRLIFWDTRPKVEDPLHSTIAILNPTRYFFKQFMRFSEVLDKGLIGMAQSRVTELSVTKNSMDFLQNNFLRANFVFEREDPFKYERMCTKITNIQVRQYIVRETYLCRKLNIFPFELFPNNKDPLMEISSLIKDKIKGKIAQLPPLTQSVVSPSNRQATAGSDSKSSQEIPAEDAILLDLAINAQQVQQLLYDEAKEFYREEDQIMSAWIQESRDKVAAKKQLMSEDADASHLIKHPSQGGHSKAFATGSLCVLDTLSIIASFSSKVFFDSAEVRSLNKKEAIVIAKDDFTKHLHGINLDLIDLIDAKYAKNLSEIQKKCEILEHDVLFQKKWNRLLVKKIDFLEENMSNIIESQVASRSNALIQQIQQLERKAAYAEDQRQVDKVKMHAEISNKFQGELRERELTNEAILSRFYDFKKGQKIEVLNMVEGIKDHNFKRLKDSIAKALDSHGGLGQTLHVVDGIWSEVNEKIEGKSRQQVNATTNPVVNNNSSQMAGNNNNQSAVLAGTVAGSQGGSVGGSGGNIGRTIRTTHTTEGEDEVIEEQQQQFITQSQQQSPPILLQTNSMMMQQSHYERDHYHQQKGVDVYERIEMQNKEVFKLLESFRLIRAFQNMKLACTVEKYERRIQSIYENNSSNEQLYRDKKEMEAQTESMKDLVISLKKTMAIMEYQNEILRRDVQRSRKERLKAMKTSKAKDDEIRDLKERIEVVLKEKQVASYQSAANSHTNIQKNYSSHSIQKRIRNSLPENSIAIRTDTSLPQPPQLQGNQSCPAGQQQQQQQQQQQLTGSVQDQSKNLFFATNSVNTLEYSGSLMKQQTPRNSTMNNNNNNNLISPASTTAINTKNNNSSKQQQNYFSKRPITATTSQGGYSELTSAKRDPLFSAASSRTKESSPDLKNLPILGQSQSNLQSAVFKRTSGITTPISTQPYQLDNRSINNSKGGSSAASAKKQKLSMTFKVPAIQVVGTSAADQKSSNN